MQRFYKFMVPDPETECWNWTGPVYNSGYGKFAFASTDVSAHRFSYELHTGEIERGKVVRHTCDNKLCVNPDHLIVGTHKQNTHDMFTRQRAPNAKLDPDKVRAIRCMRNEQDMEVKDVATVYNVKPRAIEAVLYGQNWAWVK